VLFFRFSPEFVSERGFVPPALEGMFLGGFGMVMLVNYTGSPVGDYQELLFIPGKFACGRKSLYTVTKIYVSTLASAENGRANWGLPKELAQFDWTDTGGVQSVRVTHDDQPVFEMQFRPGRLSFPFTTRLFSIPLQQPRDQQRLLTKPSAGGWANLAQIAQPQVNAALFPDISRARPVGAVYLSRFKMTFPAPKVE